MGSIPEIDDETFELKVLQAELPVLVDFGAEWCHPCKQLDPIVEELAEEWVGKVKVFKLDVDSNVNTTMNYGVMGVPSLILFVNGEPVERMTGLVPKKRILEAVEPHLDS
ncbi:MAG: thioredoxin [Anaerolineaceae bacterium]|nr:MAG: thioredoxin [Anaerolineaceae bacterium]